MGERIGGDYEGKSCLAVKERPSQQTNRACILRLWELCIGREQIFELSFILGVWCVSSM